MGSREKGPVSNVECLAGTKNVEERTLVGLWPAAARRELGGIRRALGRADRLAGLLGSGGTANSLDIGRIGYSDGL